MHNINFNHLHYFWTVARCGSIVKASAELDVSPQTISGQINLLESRLGVALFEPAGRGLILTPMGEVVLDYANDIFALADKLSERLKHQQLPNVTRLRIGIADGLSKIVVRELLKPVTDMKEPVSLVCQEGKLELLLADLALHKLDLILSDRPMPVGLSIRGYSHLLMKSAVSLMGTAALAARVKCFPEDLQDVPFLLPGQDAVLRRQMEHWLSYHRLYPQIFGEFDDGALMSAFGQAGYGVFPVPRVVAQTVSQQYNVVCLHEVDELSEHFYAISTERTITRKMILAIVQHSHSLADEGVVPQAE